MRGVLGRPVLLIPLGTVLLLDGLLLALNGIGAYRTGTAVEEGRLCATNDTDPCFEKVDARISGPKVTRRAAGRSYAAKPVDGTRLSGFSVTDDDSDRLRALDADARVMVWVKREDPEDPVAIETRAGEVVPTQWIGLRGVGAYLSFGLLIAGLGVGLLLTGVRFKRAGTPWLAADTTSPFGSAAAALLVVPAGAGVVATRLGAPPGVVLALCGVTIVCIAVALPLWWRSRR